MYDLKILSVREQLHSLYLFSKQFFDHKTHLANVYSTLECCTETSVVIFPKCLFAQVPSMVQLHVLEGILITTLSQYYIQTISEAKKLFTSTFKVILEYNLPFIPGTIFNFVYCNINSCLVYNILFSSLYLFKLCQHKKQLC